MLADSTADKVAILEPLPRRPAAVNHSETIRGQIDQALEQILDTTRRRLRLSDSQEIADEVARVVFAGGKRLRPLFACYGFAAGGGTAGQPIIKAAASLELLHTFAIIHDDLMDGSLTRRGKPTTWRAAAAGNAQPGRLRQAAQRGLSMAILAGDLALVLSDQTWSESGFSPERQQDAWTELNRMRLDAVAGQYLDLRHSGAHTANANAELALTIARLKTASYSVQGPLLVGAALANATARARSALGRFGAPLGEAFQLQDDVAGLYGQPLITGKDDKSDLHQGKMTFLIAKATELATDPQREQITRIWGDSNSSGEDFATLREIVFETGAFKQTADAITRLAATAKEALDDPSANDLDPQACRTLIEMADLVAEPKKW